MIKRFSSSSAKKQYLQSTPVGYTKVEYLESPFIDYVTGITSLFDLGVFYVDLQKGDNVKIQTEHRMTKLPNLDTEWNQFGQEGCLQPGATLSFSFYKKSRPIGGGQNAQTLVNGWGSSYDTYAGPYGQLDWIAYKSGQTPDTEWHVLFAEIDKNNHTFCLDDYKTSSETRENKTWTCPTKLFVFGQLQSDQYYVTKPLLGQKKYFKFWYNNKLTRNLHPSISKTGAPCMFDLVTRQPYYNSGTGDDFLYPTPSTTYSLRRPQAEYAKMTERGIQRLYHLPTDYKGTFEDYITQNNFKKIIETECPNEEGKYYGSRWVETDTELIVEWFEIDPPQEEFFEETIDNSQIS